MMKLKKYGVMTVCFFSLISFLTGCVRQQKEESSKFQDSRDYICMSNRVESDDGIYYISNEDNYFVLKYIDKASAKETVLCQKVNCTHNTKACQAVLEKPSYIGDIAYSNGKLYSAELMIEEENPNRSLCLYERNADGTGKKLIHEFTDMQMPPNGAAIYKGKFILSVSEIFDYEDGTGSTAGAPSLIIYDKDTKEKTTIVDGRKEKEKFTVPCGGYKNTIYFYETDLFENMKYNINQYDLKTKEMKTVWTGKQNDMQLIENEIMYIQPEGEKRIERYQLKTSEKDTVLEWNENITDVYVMNGYIEFMKAVKEDGTVIESSEKWWELNEQNVKSTVFKQWYDLKRNKYLFEEYQPENEITVRGLFDNQYLVQKNQSIYLYNIEDGTWREVQQIN